MPNVRDDIPNRPLCPECEVNLRPIKYHKKENGKTYFSKYCKPCAYKITGKEYLVKRNVPKKYREAKERRKKHMTCEMCGFKAKDTCQLDIDHIDGNHDNDDPSNHQILCANCHRLKTKLNKDGSYKKKKEK